MKSVESTNSITNIDGTLFRGSLECTVDRSDLDAKLNTEETDDDA